ncbi:MAG: peptidylprolyl isomerase [Bacteroidota bacterium]
MALIGKIRNNSWLLIVLLALGLGGFIVMDMTSGQQSVFGSNATTVADIEGRKVSSNEFFAVERILYGGGGGNTFNQRDFIWNYFLDEALVGQEAEKLGLGISNKELMELQFGNSLSPIIESRFRDPNTFQVDRQTLNTYRDAINNGTFTNPDQRAFWSHQEKEIKVDRLKSKISNLAAKAIYAPTWQVEMVGNDQNATARFAYVQVPFSEVDNGNVQLADADYKNYLQENRLTYEQEEETRKVDYVVFDVEPTDADVEEIRKDMVELAGDFKTTDNDTTFIQGSYGTPNFAYLKKADLPATIADTLLNMEVGEVYGPYEDDGKFTIAKVMNRKVIADSVRARHILLPVQDQQSGIQAFRTLDSLKNLIETGEARFDSLAAKFGTDGTRVKGGDLDFASPGQMVKPFNDLIFYDAEPNELNIIQTQFGLHLVEVTSRKYETNEEGIQVGFISEPIVPSTKTQNTINQKALKFASDNRSRTDMMAAAGEAGMDVETSLSLKKNDYTIGELGSNQTSREIVKWAFSSNASVNDVSPQAFAYQDEVNFYTNKYVVASLRSVQDAGMPSVANIKDEIEAQVLNEKKAANIREQIAGKNLGAIATQYNTSVDTTADVQFTAGFLPGLGNEPKVIAQAFSMEPGETSAPITGENGVYVITLINKPVNSNPANIPQLRRTIAGGVKAQLNAGLAQELRKDADITDNRSRFY